LKILDLFDNEILEIGNLANKIHSLDQLYLAHNNNLNCTCSINPIREWIRDHLNDEGMDNLRVNATCGWPQRLKGHPLNSLTENSLCPELQIYGFAAAAMWPSITPTTEKTRSEDRGHHGGMKDNRPAVNQITPQNTQFDHVILFIIVGAVTVTFIIVFLIILITCLKWRTRRNQRLQQAYKPPRQLRQQEEPVRNVPLQELQSLHTVRPHRHIQEDDGAYEPVRPRPPSPRDSAFGSQDDVSAVEEEEALSWLEPTNRVPPCGSENPNEFDRPNSPYMTMEEWRAKYAFTDEEPPLLASQWHITNPFIEDTREDQAVPTPKTHVSLEEKLTTPYIPHEFFNNFFLTSPNQESHTHMQRENCMQAESPHQNPEHPQQHYTPDILGCKSTNPFQNSPNPFISCV
jgi:hypothetical protein